MVVPLLLQEGDGGGWSRGLGDVAFAVKHVLLHSLERGHILSAAGEMVLPTGKESAGLGSGVTIFEPFVAFGQLLPADGFLQVQAGLELPFDSDRADERRSGDVAVGKTLHRGALRPLVVADGGSAGRTRPRGRRDHALGSRAADAGHAQPAAAPHDQRRRAGSRSTTAPAEARK